MPNQLAHETSPYLLQHADNPVDWQPWGSAAIEQAKREERPIFLSIGYSACHWCHVMEHESFEDPRIAKLLNDRFVCIKVDREERPDLDQIYMQAVQAMTGRGGWPMSVFLTPDLRPFYGGTYWPPTARMGMPGFDQVVVAVAEAWHSRREQALEQAESLADHLREAAAPLAAHGQLSPELLDAVVPHLARQFDPRHGGFGVAPKFPHPMDLRLLLRLWRRTRQQEPLQMVVKTLDEMARGGMYDQLGGGFHRYSVDAHWLVPHFEKMLYDNALLTIAYLDAFVVTGRQDFARVARETCDYVLREMTSPEGGFYSTQDADSEGVEGKYFVWTPEEIAAALGAPAADVFCQVYGVTRHGNFEEKNILHLSQSIEAAAASLGRDAVEFTRELAEARERLLAARRDRVPPGLDDKVLVAWNGLMIDALAQASVVLVENRYLDAARRAADFILSQMRDASGRLSHTWRRGAAKLAAYLDDYASLIVALTSLYEASFEERRIDEAIVLAEEMLAKFSDPLGGFFLTADDQSTPIARPKDLFDNATPSGSALAATGLLRLGRLTGREDFLAAAERTMESAAGIMRQSPSAAGQMLIAYETLVGSATELVFVADPASSDTQDILNVVYKRFLPHKLVALRRPAQAASRGAAQSSALDPLFAGRQAAASPTLHICQGATCQAPLVGRDAILAAISQLAE